MTIYHLTGQRRLANQNFNLTLVPVFPAPCSRFSIPGSRFSIPGSRFPVPGSRFSVPGFAKRLEHSA